MRGLINKPTLGDRLRFLTNPRSGEFVKYLESRRPGGKLPSGKRRKSKEGYFGPYTGKNAIREEHTPMRKIVSLVEARRKNNA